MKRKNEVKTNGLKGEYRVENVIVGTDGDDILMGTSEDDELSGQDGDDHLYGGAGNDYLFGGAGNDYFEGGEGDDYIKNRSGNARVKYNFGDGCDRLYLSNGQNIIEFGEGIHATDLRFARNGNEPLEGVAVYLGENKILDLDHMIYSPEDLSMEFVDGTILTPSDILNAIDGVYYGTEGGDVYDGTEVNQPQNIKGNGGDDVLKGGAWKDSINGGLGNDNIQGNGGNDFILGAQGDDVIEGGDGDDDIWGGEGSNKIWGGMGNDLIRGNLWGEDATSAVEELYGGDGNDLIWGGVGSTYIEGGYGDDYISVTEGTSTVKYNLGDGYDRLDLLYGEHAIHFGEGIELSDLEFKVNGVFQSYRGVTVHCEGEVVLDIERMIDLNENISMVFADGMVLTPSDIINLVQGYFNGTGEDDYYDGAEIDVSQYLRGNGGNDILIGGIYDDALDGGQGNDILMGGAGNDYINGGSGNDRVFGGAGDDKLNAGNADVYFEGGEGNDYIRTWGGTAVIAYNYGDGVDRINDINNEQHNTLRFGEGIEKADIELALGSCSNDVEVLLGGDKIMTVEKFGEYASQYAFEFADGSNLTGLEFCAEYNWKFGTKDNDEIWDGGNNNIIYGLYGNDKIYGEQGNDEIHGNSGNDSLYGGNGADDLNGGFGHDDLWGGHGDDVLKGSRGYDNLYGEAGNDTYLISKDTDEDYITESSGQDTIAFEKAFKVEKAVVKQMDLDLEISFSDMNVEVVVKNYFVDNAHKVEYVTFRDGTVWDQGTLESKIQTQQLTQAMAGFSPVEAVGSVAVEEPVKTMELQLAAAV